MIYIYILSRRLCVVLIYRVQCNTCSSLLHCHFDCFSITIQSWRRSLKPRRVVRNFPFFHPLSPWGIYSVQAGIWPSSSCDRDVESELINCNIGVILWLYVKRLACSGVLFIKLSTAGMHAVFNCNFTKNSMVPRSKPLPVYILSNLIKRVWEI